eukprot:1158702-Pelagomonas_calceolata.AAC.9
MALKERALQGSSGLLFSGLLLKGDAVKIFISFALAQRDQENVESVVSSMCSRFKESPWRASFLDHNEEAGHGGAAAAGDAKDLVDEEDTTAAVASWRAWRFLQESGRTVFARTQGVEALTADASNTKHEYASMIQVPQKRLSEHERARVKCLKSD